MNSVHQQLLVVDFDNALGAALLTGVAFLVTRWWQNPLAAYLLCLMAHAFAPLSTRANPAQETPAAGVTGETAMAEQPNAPAEPEQARADGPGVARSAQAPLDPRLGPGTWVDPQVRGYLRNYMLRPEWDRSMATIKGRVVDTQGNPAANVDVTAQTYLFGTIAVDRTDQRGEFEMISADSNAALVATSNDGALIGYFRAPPAEDDRRAQPYIVRLEPPREIDAHVVDGEGQPVSTAIVTIVFGGGLTSVANTDAQGRAKQLLPKDVLLEAVFARKDNVGLDVLTFDNEEKPERSVAGSRFEFTLKGARTVAVRMVDRRNGETAPGIIASYVIKRNGRRNANLYTLAELCRFVGDAGAAGFSFAPSDESAWVGVRVLDSTLRANYFPHFTGPTALKSRPSGLEIRSKREFRKALLLRAADGEREPFNEVRAALFDGMPSYGIHFRPQGSGNECTLEFWPKVKLTGQVRFADGRPAPGTPVHVEGSRHRASGHSDVAGRFEFEVDANDYYLIAARAKHGASKGEAVVVGHDPPPPVQLTLGPAIRVYGRQLRNLRGFPITLTQLPERPYEALPRNELLPLRLTLYPIHSELRTPGPVDAQGQFEFFVGPGTYYLQAHPILEIGVLSSPFTLTDEKEYDVDRGLPSAANSRVKVRMVRSDDPQVGLGRARYYVHRFDGQSPESKRADADGFAEVDSLGSRFVIESLDADEKLVGMVECKLGETELLVPLGPPAVVRGRLIDRAGRRFGGRVDFQAVYGSQGIHSGIIPTVSQGRAAIDDEGRFVLDRLTPGWTYSLSAYLDYPGGPGEGRLQSVWLGTAQPGAASVDLGDLPIEPAF